MANTVTFSNNSSTSVAKDCQTTSPPTTKYFLYFIPARLAVFLLCFLLFSFGLAYGAVGWIIANELDKQLLEIERLAVFFHILVYFSMAMFAGLGLFAAIQKHAKSTSLFASTILGQFVFSLASGGLCLYLLFRTGNSIDGGYRKCLDAVAAKPDDFFLRNLCERSSLMKGLSVSLYIFMWFMEIVSVIASNRYSAQLHEEAAQMQILYPTAETRESFYC